MNFLSLFFWTIFIIPFVIFLGWLLKQDKRKGKAGIVILAVIVIVGVVYMYMTTKGK